MRLPLFYSLVAVMLTCAQGALPQSAVPRQVWIQLETRLHLDDSLDSIEIYARDLVNVNGFEINGGWYGVAIGPYDPEQADAALQNCAPKGLSPAPASPQPAHPMARASTRPRAQLNLTAQTIRPKTLPPRPRQRPVPRKSLPPRPVPP